MSGMRGSLLWLAGLVASPVATAAPHVAYTRAVEFVRSVYLYPDRVDAPGLLGEAAVGLSHEVDWLVVDVADGAVHLRHGSGAPLGSVSVASLQTLPMALQSLEELVTTSGYPVGDVDVRLEILDGMTQALDRYSRVLSGDRLDRFDVRLKGTLIGIGVAYQLIEARPRLTEVTPGSPAALAGLRPGDVLRTIGGVSTLNMTRDDVSERIRGDAGTVLVLGIGRDGAEFDVRVTRAEVEVPNVHHEVLDDHVGVVTIDHFSQRTVEQLDVVMRELASAGALSRGLVIDLRGNTGGSMKEAARVADRFLTSGLLLRTAGRDGEAVANLQDRMEATATGDEPHIPVVVLMDRQTASGSEILAGALLAHHRAVLVGSRSFGKGTVQKVYELDADVRLKLTVAQFLLAGDLSVADRGLSPDVAIGTVVLDGDGASYRGFDEADAGVPPERVVLGVEERHGWRGVEDASTDHAMEIARRAILASNGWDREPVLEALGRVAREYGAEQEQRLVEAYAAKDLDWSPAAAAAGPMDAQVRVTARPSPAGGDAWLVEAEVRNTGAAPLHRALVTVRCDSLSSWDDVVVPVGRVAAGASARGAATVHLRPGMLPREDVVSVDLRADKRPTLAAGDAVLASSTGAPPILAAQLALVGAGDARHVRVTLRNRSPIALRDVEVSFQATGDASFELVDREATIASLPARGTASVDLGLRLAPDAPTDALPLDLVVESAGWRRLATWPIRVPTDGRAVYAQPPDVVAADPVRSAPTGRYPVHVVAEDDVAVDHLVLWADGEKVAWADGRAGVVDLLVDVELLPGANRFVAEASDRDGLVTRTTFVIRGEGTAAVDAADPEAPRPFPGRPE